MEHFISQQKQTVRANIKEEPLDVDFKQELFDYQDIDYNESELLSESSNIWSLLVKRCRLLLQEEYGQMNSYLLTKLLIKESNQFLSAIVKFFQDCCMPASQEEIQCESTLEVDGLLVNCLPCHPKNLKCCYKICSDLPKTYLETLFSLLPSEVVEDDDYLPMAPNVEVDIKTEVTDTKTKKKSKKSKSNKEAKQKKKHICDICGKSYNSSCSLKEHVSSVHEKKKPFKCRKCGASYSSRGGLKHHKKPGQCTGLPKNENRWIKWKNPGKEEPLDPKCLHPDCFDKEQPKFTYAGIMNHIIDLHSPGSDDSKNLQCPECPKRFPMGNVLKYHQQKEHGANAQICNICGKVVINGRMKVHIQRAHTNEKNLQCDKCDFRTANHKDIKRHMYTHSEDPMEGRDYLCEICHKAFFTTQELKQHLMIHSGIKPYKCKLCSGTFSNFSGHRQHMMKTHGVKFTCDICGKDSSSMKALDIHKKAKHDIIK